ncbi:DUF4153 domain-containing protein [Consotaella aegiceratis]|uniref:DUF4153 domain-containing protein n=1 Tax=Consotaella aegiceratis TaxID=3097961 RepID=UPI002F402623
MQTTVLRSISRPTIHSGPYRLLLVVLLVAASDALFYGRQVGLSLPVFLVLLTLAAIAGNRLHATRREWTLAGLILALALAPLVEAVGLLSILFGFAGAAAFALIVTGRARAAWPTRARRLLLLMTGRPFTTANRLARWWQSHRSSTAARLSTVAAAWLVPLVLGAIFATLFSQANPIFRSWMPRIDLRWLFNQIAPERMAFWLLVAVFVSGFVGVSRFRRRRSELFDGLVDRSHLEIDLSRGLVVRSLAICNAVFALETVLDAVYLWGGAKLPAGVTPAADAQEAAYILVLTALLAAAFVLIAMRDGSKARSSRLVRWLIYLWIAQNVVLVLSAMLRLGLYVEMYSLTRLRLAAGVWMGLVATGLALIVVRIATERNNGWLLKVNLAILGLVLYACSLVDANAVVARYNVAHSREVSGHGQPVDQHYLCQLGPSALPAIETFLKARPPVDGTSERLDCLASCVQRHRLTLKRRSDDWRSWTFREHRLRATLAAPIATPGREAGDGADDSGRR